MISTLKLRIASIHLLWILVFYHPSSLFAQTFEFAKRLGCDKAADWGRDITVDKQGNILTTGFFRSFNGIGAEAADFDPGPGFYPMWSYLGGLEAFISKLDSNGNFVWARQFDGTGGAAIGYTIVTDPAGNIYVSGNFSGEVDFDPGTGVANHSSTGSYDVFVVKLSSAGNFIWAKSFGGILEETNTDLALDNDGNIYISGSFTLEADFDPGPGTFLLNAEVYMNGYIVKLEPNGNFIWAKNMGGSGGEFSLSPSNEILYYTTFEGISDANPSINEQFIVTSQGGLDFFISKLNNEGEFLWAKGFGSKLQDYGSNLEVDSKGNIVLSGSFQGDSLFNYHNGTLLASSNIINSPFSTFLSKLSPSGEFLWTVMVGDSGKVDFGEVVIFRNKDIYFSGNFRDSVDFDPGPATHFEKAKGSPGAFILKFDSAGRYQKVLVLDGVSYIIPASLCTDSLNNLFLTGWFTSGFINGTVDFDPGPGVFSMNGTTAGGIDDIFILKLSQCQISDTISGNYCGSVTINQTSYSQSGTYSQRFNTQNGCDSTLILRLNIFQPVQSARSYQLCPGQSIQVGNKTYNTPGIYLDTLTAANGCDSLITSTLNYDIPNDTIRLSAQFGALAAPNQDSYQWLDCNLGFTPIAGETDSSFAPSVSGSYAVRVTKGACADTSACLLATSASPRISKSAELEVFPNPNSGKATVRWWTGTPGDRVLVSSLEGKVVLRLVLNSDRTAHIQHLPSGVYVLKVEKQGIKPVRVMVE